MDMYDHSIVSVVNKKNILQVKKNRLYHISHNVNE